MNHSSNKQITFFGRTNFRGEHWKRNKVFGIKQSDRRLGVWIVGKTGTGKSTLLGNMCRQDVAASKGFALLDPHGDLVAQVLAWIPEDRKGNLIYFNVADASRPLAFNPLESVPPDKRPLVASGLLEAFKKIWDESWGPRTEHILRNVLLTLFDQPEATLADIPRLLDDKDFRSQALQRVQSPQVRRFWLKEYSNYTFGIRALAILPIQNKVGAFLANPLLHNILVQKKSAFDLRQVIDEGKILLVNLAKGKIGEDTGALLGALLTTKIGLAGLSRADVPEAQRHDWTLYADEFQNITTLSLANMLSELRKYGVSMVLAHQYLSQLDPQIRDAILGNVGTVIVFRVGAADASFLAKELAPVFESTDLLTLPNYNVYLKLMIDGSPSKPFSAEILSPSHFENAESP